MNSINIIFGQQSTFRPDYENINIQNYSLSGEKYNNIFVGHGISQLEHNIVPKFLEECLNRLGAGGSLYIQDIDISLAGYNVGVGKIPPDKFSELIKGKTSHHSIYSLLFMLEKTGKCICSKKSVENNQFTLEVTKTSE